MGSHEQATLLRLQIWYIVSGMHKALTDKKWKWLGFLR